MQESPFSSFHTNNNESDTSTVKLSKDKQKLYKLILRKKNLVDNSPEITKISEINSENIKFGKYFFIKS